MQSSPNFSTAMESVEEKIKSLPRAKKERALALARELKHRKHYQINLVDWMVERLGVSREMIDWQLLPEYTGHKWDGTPNPLVRICENMEQSKWTAVEGATGVSKTFLAAAIVLWFLECFDNSLVVTTAPKERQLELHIWKEIQKFHDRFARGNLVKLLLRMNPPSDDWIAVGFVAGVKASEQAASATKAQGFHAEHMLIITEETPGISNAIMNAFQLTSIAPHNIILALGNPDHQLDTLHRFSQMDHVDHVVISGYDYPNVILKKPGFIPGGQTEIGLGRLMTIFKSDDNPLYLSRARGISPAQSTDALVRLEWIRRAQERPTAEEGKPSLGVDVANSTDGDLAAIAEGTGSTCTLVDAFPCPNANKLGEMVYHKMLASKIADEDVAVDGVGVGAGTVNELLRLGRQIANIQSGAKPIAAMKNGIEMKEDFDNLRSQMWWQLRMDLQEEESDLVLPLDDELVADLVTPKYRVDKGKIRVESKLELKKRLGRSPNKGDAFVYWNWIREHRDTIAAIKPEATEAREKELVAVERSQLVNPKTNEDLQYYHAQRRRSW